jgi:hypothetical protein
VVGVVVEPRVGSRRPYAPHVLGEELVEQVVVLAVEVRGLRAELLLFLVKELAVWGEEVVSGP